MSTHNICICRKLEKKYPTVVKYPSSPQIAFYVKLHRAVIGPSATLTGRRRSDIDLRRMLTGSSVLNSLLIGGIPDKCMGHQSYGNPGIILC